MSIVHTGGVMTSDAPTTLKTKRASSGRLDANTLGAFSSIIHNTVPITVTAIRCYSTVACAGGALKIDVGIDGTADSIVSAAAIGATNKGDVDTITIGTAAVAAGHTITASVETADGAGGEVQILIEYIDAN